MSSSQLVFELYFPVFHKRGCGHTTPCATFVWLLFTGARDQAVLEGPMQNMYDKVSVSGFLEETCYRETAIPDRSQACIGETGNKTGHTYSGCNKAKFVLGKTCDFCPYIDIATDRMAYCVRRDLFPTKIEVNISFRPLDTAMYLPEVFVMQLSLGAGSM